MSYIIKVRKTNQCGDYFLFSFNCPKCNEEHLETVDSIEGKICECGFIFNEAILDVGGSVFKLTVGTMRKVILSIKKIKIMYDNQEGKCAYCQKELFHKYHIEHIIPLSAGGTNRNSNICLSCPTCNLKASSLVFRSFESKQKYILDSIRR